MELHVAIEFMRIVFTWYVVEKERCKWEGRNYGILDLFLLKNKNIKNIYLYPVHVYANE